MTVKYNCSICNYETSKKGNYSRHIGSVKHQKKVGEINNLNSNINPRSLPDRPRSLPDRPRSPKMSKNEEIYECDLCGLKCSRYSSLVRHKNSCSNKKVAELVNKLNEKTKEHDIAIRIKDKELDLKDNQIDELKSDLIYYKNLIKTAGVGSGAKITTNVQSLIVSKHDDAPAIEYAKPNLLKFNSKDSYENSLFLINRYKDNTFTMFVGKCIVAACKKEDPDEQSIWSTDANRLTMFIKKMMDDDSKWISDKKGVQTTKYLINPILKKIKEMLIDYNKHLYSQINKLPQHEVDYYNDIMIHCRELVHFIEHEKLADEILRYMAPRLTYEIK